MIHRAPFGEYRGHVIAIHPSASHTPDPVRIGAGHPAKAHSRKTDPQVFGRSESAA